MKPLSKIVFLVFLTAGNNAFSQPGLNVQNRINSKVQTRVQGRVANSPSARAAAASKLAAGKNKIPEHAFYKPNQKIVSATVIKSTAVKEVPKNKLSGGEKIKKGNFYKAKTARNMHMKKMRK